MELDPLMADVERLNAHALAGDLEVTKVSLGVAPHIAENYVLLSSGSALGWGCGPLVVARRGLTTAELAMARVAIPGKMTTANLLLDLHGGFKGPRVEMLFSEIMPAVAQGEFDLGVLIHEGRFTYETMNLVKILDLGQWWEEKFHLPLPLGAIAAHRDLPAAIILSMQRAIAASLNHARANPDDSAAFIRQHAQELDEGVTRAHIDTFVTDYSLDLGETGRKAIETLTRAALVRQGGNLDRNLFV